jgi:hypothetical protein
MTKRIMLLGLACGLIVSSTGCGLLRCLLCPTSLCDPQHCAAACGPACGASCGGTCGETCEAGCDLPPAATCQPAHGTECGSSCAAPCGPSAAPCGPLSWICRLFASDGWPDGGCGEIYCGDWCSEPPDCCDPCDQWGNYTGGGFGGYPGGYVQGTIPEGVRISAAPEVRKASEPTK